MESDAKKVARSLTDRRPQAVGQVDAGN